MDASVPDRNALSSEAQKLLGALLKDNEIGRVQISTKRLLKDSGLTEGALMRARSELTQHSLLRTEPGISANGLRGANVYVLNMLEIDPPKEEGAPDPASAESVVEEVLEAPEEVPETSGRHRSGRRGLLGFFWRSDRTS